MSKSMFSRLVKCNVIVKGKSCGAPAHRAMSTSYFCKEHDPMKKHGGWRDDYFATRALPNGEIIGIGKQMFTTSLIVGMDERGYRGRFCYEHLVDALDAFACWDGTGDPTGPWIKYKGVPAERLGPGAVGGDL